MRDDVEMIEGYIYSEIRLTGNIQDLPPNLHDGVEWTITTFDYGRDGVTIGVRRLAMRGEEAGKQISEAYRIYVDESLDAVYNHETFKYDNVHPIRAAFLADFENDQPIVGRTITYITFEDDEALEKHPAWKEHVEAAYDDHPDDKYRITDKGIRLFLRTVKDPEEQSDIND